MDAAVQAAAEAGVSVAPASAASAGGGTVDAAAVDDLRDELQSLLAGPASSVLAQLGRGPLPAEDASDTREALAKLALLEAEHGPASMVAPKFDARRHVLLASGAAWARADVEHLVGIPAGRGGRTAAADLEALLEQVVVQRVADPRIADTLNYHRSRAEAGGCSATVALIDRALSDAPRGVDVPELAKLGTALGEGPAAEVVSAAADLAAEPGPFAGKVALVAGASPGSMAWSSVAHLLRGGATVVVVTTTDTPERIAAYRDLERRYAGPDAQLHVVRANLASFADIDSLLDWLTTPTIETVGPVSREVKPALWPDFVLPFAAAPAGGELPDTREDAQLTLRLLLLGVQRLVGGLAERAAADGRGRFTVILPMSPNHGTFGGDGAYGDAKAALETMANKWHSEGSRWGSQTGLISAEIGWVRGTGLMAANDRIASYIESELGVTTYASEQMGALIAALATPEFVERASEAPLKVVPPAVSADVPTWGQLAKAVQELSAGSWAEAESEPAGIAALPNLPTELLTARVDLTAPERESRATISAEDMIVMVGIAELGPWGTSSTRWQAELGGLTAAGVVELAWRTGLIAWDPAKGGWTDAESGESVDEAEVAERYRDEVVGRAGVRRLEATDEIAADGYEEYSEVFLDEPLTKQVSSEAEARALAADHEGASVTRGDEGWILTLPAGASLRLSRRRPLLRSVGGQFRAGSTRPGTDWTRAWQPRWIRSPRETWSSAPTRWPTPASRPRSWSPACTPASWATRRARAWVA